MSLMPDLGTVVRLKDGRVAVVSHFTPLGDDDRVIFSDGHDEKVTAWLIGEELTEGGAADPLDALRRYLHDHLQS